ncbi:MAG: SDR family NAD(P)-dependent oxidoreductase [Acholeplasmataceae bacterium]
MKRIIITGATSGIGKALVHGFASREEQVIALGRNKDRLDRLSRTNAGMDVVTMLADLSRFSDVKKAIDTITTRYRDGIDVLINNAAIVSKEKRITEDGFELQYQVNHLSAALLTLSLMPLVEKRRGMIIQTSSNAHRKARFDPDDIEATKRYHSLRSYARTKLYNLLFTLALRRKVDRDIRFHAVHPGLVRTEIGTKDTSALYAWVWRRFTSRGIDPKDAVHSFTRLVYDHFLDAPYIYREREHEPSRVALSVENQDVLYQKTISDLGSLIGS